MCTRGYFSSGVMSTAKRCSRQKLEERRQVASSARLRGMRCYARRVGTRDDQKRNEETRERARAGLCADCVHARRIIGSRREILFVETGGSGSRVSKVSGVAGDALRRIPGEKLADARRGGGREAMAMQTVLQLGDPKLREVASPVADARSPEIATLVEIWRTRWRTGARPRGTGRGIAAPKLAWRSA